MLVGRAENISALEGIENDDLPRVGGHRRQARYPRHRQLPLEGLAELFVSTGQTRFGLITGAFIKYGMPDTMASICVVHFWPGLTRFTLCVYRLKSAMKRYRGEIVASYLENIKAMVKYVPARTVLDYMPEGNYICLHVLQS